MRPPPPSTRLTVLAEEDLWFSEEVQPHAASLRPYAPRRNLTLFANLNNLTDAPLDVEIHGPTTPEHAPFRQRQTFGSMWTFGVKGPF